MIRPARRDKSFLGALRRASRWRLRCAKWRALEMGCTAESFCEFMDTVAPNWRDGR